MRPIRVGVKASYRPQDLLVPSIAALRLVIKRLGSAASVV